MSASARIAAFHDEMTAWRRDIHAHPELGFEEDAHRPTSSPRSSRSGASRSRPASARPASSAPSASATIPRAIGLRADMDALPMDEHNTFDHRSQHKGRMHACGHDGHTTMLLGAAKYLAATRNFDGTVHFIFQPAEEGRGGAEAMVKDGLFEKFPCEQIFGMHNRPKLDVGKFAIRSGPADGGRRLVRHPHHRQGRARRAAGERHRSGDHRHADHLGAAERRVAQRAPLDSAVISVTQMHAGDAYNVIPQEARAARHHPRLPQGDDGADQGAHRDDLERHRADAGRQRQGRRARRSSRRWSTTTTR